MLSAVSLQQTHLPVRAETRWPRARGGWCCTFSLPRSGCRQDDFPTPSISTLTGVISSHFPGESFGGLAGAVVLVQSQRGQIISLDCELLWKWRWHLWLLVCPASLRTMLSALSHQGFQLCPQDLPHNLLWPPPHVHISVLVEKDMLGDATTLSEVFMKELKCLDLPQRALDCS